MGIIASCSQLGLLSASDRHKGLPLPSLSVPVHIVKSWHLPASSGQSVWTTNGRGHGHLSSCGISLYRHAHCTFLPWVKIMVHGDLDACISQWLFLQTIVQCLRRTLWLKTIMFEISSLKTPLETSTHSHNKVCLHSSDSSSLDTGKWGGGVDTTHSLEDTERAGKMCESPVPPILSEFNASPTQGKKV